MNKNILIITSFFAISCAGSAPDPSEFGEGSGGGETGGSDSVAESSSSSSSSTGGNAETSNSSVSSTVSVTSTSSTGDPCEPKTSCSENECGVWDDSCGGTIDCGDSCNSSPYAVCSGGHVTSDGEVSEGTPGICGGECIRVADPEFEAYCGVQNMNTPLYWVCSEDIDFLGEGCEQYIGIDSKGTDWCCLSSFS